MREKLGTGKRGRETGEPQKKGKASRNGGAEVEPPQSGKKATRSETKARQSRTEAEGWRAFAIVAIIEYR
jgi:hypothetical protein